MSTPAQLCLGLMVLCLSAAFAVGLGSLLQYRAIARSAAAQIGYAEVQSADRGPAMHRSFSF